MAIIHKSVLISLVPYKDIIWIHCSVFYVVTTCHGCSYFIFNCDNYFQNVAWGPVVVHSFCLAGDMQLFIYLYICL